MLTYRFDPNLLEIRDTYRIIVHRDHRADFLAELFKRRLLKSLEWAD